MEGYLYIFLIIVGEEKVSTSGIKAGLKNSKHVAQNNKFDFADS